MNIISAWRRQRQENRQVAAEIEAVLTSKATMQEVEERLHAILKHYGRDRFAYRPRLTGDQYRFICLMAEIERERHLLLSLLRPLTDEEQDELDSLDQEKADLITEARATGLYPPNQPLG